MSLRAPLTIIVSYRGIPRARGWATGDYLVEALRRLGHTVHPYGHYFQTTEPLGEPIPREVDLIIYCECNDSDPQYDELKAVRTRVMVYWDFDVDNGRFESTSELVQSFRFDAIFYANKLYGPQFERFTKRAYFLPYGIADQRFKPLGREPTIDVGLVGSGYPARVAYFKALNRLLRGSGAQAKLVEGVLGDDYVAAINRLKIHLNLNIYEHGGEGLLVLRVWETLGCGVLLLTQRKDFIEDFFEDGRHVALFETPDECAEKIRYYLEHEDERLRIAQAGHEEGLKHHTYVTRAETIVARVREIMAEPGHEEPRSRLTSKAAARRRALSLIGRSLPPTFRSG